MPAGKWRNSIGGAVRPRLCGWIGGMCPSLTVRQVSPKLLKRFLQNTTAERRHGQATFEQGLVLGLLSLGSMTAHADAAGGNGCGWGNMVFEGQRGLFPHLLATTTNGTSGNATFGMTSGTNGCNTNARLGYGGRSIFAMNGCSTTSPRTWPGPGRSARRLCRTARRGSQGPGALRPGHPAAFRRDLREQGCDGRAGPEQHPGGDESRRHPGALRQATGLRFQAQERARYGGLFVCAACPPEVAASVATADERLGHTAFSPGRFLRRGKAAPKCFRLAGPCRPWTFPADSCDIAPTAIVR